MISAKTTCDKCGKEIHGRVYRVDVEFVGDYRYSEIQIPKYQSYDICSECMKSVITDDVVGSQFRRILTPSMQFCV